MRLLFLTKYGRLGASSRYRSFQYLPYLESHGCICSVECFFDDDYLKNLYASGRKSLWAFVAAIVRRLRVLARAGQYNLLVVEKELIPYCPAIFERILRLCGVRFVVDYDDALFHLYDNHPRAIVRLLLGKKISTVMSQATAVIAGNKYLADYARTAGSACVHILPTVVDLHKYSVKTDFSRSGEFTVGWIGSLTTTVFLKDVAPALQSLAEQRHLKLLLIGAGAIDIPGVQIESHPWSEAAEVQLLKRCDVGIMPLPDAPWERGKCGFKLIQYMACGLPVVASPVGGNTEIVEEGVNGLLADDYNAWIKSLGFLRDHPEECARMGAAGRMKVEDFYSLQGAAPKLLEFLRDAVIREATGLK